MNNIKTYKELKKEILRDFTKFLKENNIYQQYRTNLLRSLINTECLKPNDWKVGFLYGIQMKNKKLYFERCYELINYAFIWEATPQGHTFWSKYCTKWRNLFFEKYRQYEEMINQYQ